MLILIMASHPSRRGSNFCRFLASDVEKITIFWESTLCEIIAFFRLRQSLCKTKFQKKLLFWGIFPDVFFIIFPFPGYVFTLCFLGGPRRPVGRPKKRHFFGFFRVRQYGAFWLQRSHCGDGYHISPPTGLNLESAEINTSKLAKFKTTNVKIHPAVPQVYTHLISFGQMEMANASGIFGNALVGLRAWNDAIHDFRRSVRHLKKCCFFGPRLPDDGPKKSWLPGWLAFWLAGWLAIWLAIWLVGWLAI